MTTSIVAAQQGKLFKEILDRVVDLEIPRSGDSKKNRNLSISAAYIYIQGKFKVSQSTARLYVKIYEKFGDDEEALSMLSVGELSVLTANAVTDEDVRAVVATKKKHATLSPEHPPLNRRDIGALLVQIRAGNRTEMDQR